MNDTLFELRWYWNDNQFSHCSVTPLRVVYEYVDKGSTEPRIVAIDRRGVKSHMSLKYCFKTEEDAWQHAKAELKEAIQDREKQIAELQGVLDAMREYLHSLT